MALTKLAMVEILELFLWTSSRIANCERIITEAKLLLLPRIFHIEVHYKLCHVRLTYYSCLLPPGL